MIQSIESAVTTFYAQLGERRGPLEFARAIRDGKLTAMHLNGVACLDAHQVETLLASLTTDADRRIAAEAAARESAAAEATTEELKRFRREYVNPFFDDDKRKP